MMTIALALLQIYERTVPSVGGGQAFSFGVLYIFCEQRGISFFQLLSEIKHS
jgi:hypothetical protein